LRQGVIICGGLGTRLMPITEFTPKPLIPINGRPIIYCQIDQLLKLGCQSILVLSGYLGDELQIGLISEYQSEEIRVVQTPSDFDPIKRLRDAEKYLDEFICLIYSDNYIPENAIIKKCLEIQSKPNFLLHHRGVGNVKVLSDDRILYTSEERTSDYSYVELGYLGTTKDQIVRSKASSLQEFISDLTENLECSHITLDSDYFSISTLSKYLEINHGRIILLLDRDGIINEKMSIAEYVTDYSEISYISENIEGIIELSRRGVDFIIITNQPGVARGQVTEKALREIHLRISSYLRSKGVNILAVYACKHGWHDGCDCRKPEPGNILAAAKDFCIPAGQLALIGDDARDCEAVERAGGISIYIGKENEGNLNFPTILSGWREIHELLARRKNQI